MVACDRLGSAGARLGPGNRDRRRLERACGTWGALVGEGVSKCIDEYYSTTSPSKTRSPALLGCARLHVAPDCLTHFLAEAGHQIAFLQSAVS